MWPPETTRARAGSSSRFDALASPVAAALVEEDGMDVALKMVDCDEWDVLRVGQGLCVGDADEEGAGKART